MVISYSVCIYRPINSLQSSHSHFIHVVIFGAMASDILSSIFNPPAQFIVDLGDTPWSASELCKCFLIITNSIPVHSCSLLLALIFYGQVFLQTLYFFPLLACTHAPVEIMGYSFGLIYSLYL